MLSLAACSSSDTTAKAQYPENRDDAYQNQVGSIFQDDGGITLFSSGDKNKGGGNTGLGVNGFLWRASLDTISFMPITSADPIGGLIITDWYSPAATPNERIKLNVVILDRELRADGVRVTVFRQQKTSKGIWQDVPAAPSTAVSLEDTILTRARGLRVAYESAPK